MHSLCVVVGSNPDDALAPYAEYLKVDRYKSYLSPDEISQMAEHYGIPPTDLSSLAAKLPEWQGGEGGVDAGRLFFWSTENPRCKYDWYAVGGRFSGYFRLRQPIPPSWWQRLLGRGPVDRVDRAVKGQVDVQAILADPPASLLFDGTWHECPITTDERQLSEWNGTFATLLETVPGDAVLTAVDLHS